MLTDNEIAAILELGYEQRGVEFKAAGSRSDRPFLANVARATLALSNQRDGGHLIIGLSEEGLDSSNTGLSEDQLREWLSFDDVSDQINAYADPPAQLQIAAARLPNGRPVVVLEVAEFSEVPILSKKDYPSKIAAKQLYTRSMAKPESSASLTQNELREVLTLATEKQLARFLETARRAGVGLGPSATATAHDQFDSQARLAEQSDFHLALDLPLFRTVIHPEGFDTSRVPFQKLLPSVQRATVRRRGWPFPWVQHTTNGRNWVGEQIDTMHPETWQFFETGLFLDYRQIENYGPDSDGFSDGEASGYLPIWLPLTHFTEVIEFGARLQREQFDSETMTINLELNNILGYELVTAHQQRSGLHSSYRYNDDAWEYQIMITPEDGLTKVREFAAGASLDLLQRFGWRGVTLELLGDIQREAFGPEQGSA